MTTEAEARAKYPPNCPRCVWLGMPFGLMRCVSCALTAIRKRDREREQANG